MIYLRFVQKGEVDLRDICIIELCVCVYLYPTTINKAKHHNDSVHRTRQQDFRITTSFSEAIQYTVLNQNNISNVAETENKRNLQTDMCRCTRISMYNFTSFVDLYKMKTVEDTCLNMYSRYICSEQENYVTSPTSTDINRNRRFIDSKRNNIMYKMMKLPRKLDGNGSKIEQINAKQSKHKQ